MSVRAERVIRERVMIRDNYTCQRPGCGKPATDAGHIIARSQGGAYTEDNLQAECTTHNRSEGWELGHQTTSAGTGDDYPATGGARMSEPAPETTTTTATDVASPEVAAAAPAETKPEETTEQQLARWKKQARENENQAKANAKAAQELEKLKKANQTDAERIADEAATARKEADEARAEMARWKAAATHHVSEDYFDLLGTGTTEEITARAERVGKLEAAMAELTKLKADMAAAATAAQTPPGNQPVSSLKPGAAVVPDDSYPSSWFPQLRPVETTNQ